MARPVTFSFSGIAVIPWRPPSESLSAHASPPTSPAGLPSRAHVQDPIWELLQSLRGREVELQVGDRLVAGKLVTYNPVLLVDREGRSTMVRFEAIRAVTF